MNTRKNEGITIVTLVITIVLLLIISGISITGALRGHEETEDATQFSELNMIQQVIYERYTKAQLTKETLPGTTIDKSDVQSIVDEINTLSSGEDISLKGTEYKELSTSDLENLGITKEQDTFIVNYKTGEVINKTQKITKSGRALYVYSKEIED